MAAKKFYAVKKGHTTGIFTAWADCKASVDGYPGAEYKGFATLAEAKTYMGNIPADSHKGISGSTPADSHKGISGSTPADFHKGISGNTPTDSHKGTSRSAPADSHKDTTGDSSMTSKSSKEVIIGHSLLAYVDGSYDHSLMRYAFGCVFLLEDGRIYTAFGNGNNPDSLQHRNVTGEMLGAMYAVKTAIFNGYSAIEICYDYQGIEKWVTGEWRSKVELTQKYAAAMRNWSKQIHITFTKVAAHTNVTYNELADQMAKKGLVEGDGIPKIKKMEDLPQYHQD